MTLGSVTGHVNPTLPINTHKVCTEFLLHGDKVQKFEPALVISGDRVKRGYTTVRMDMFGMLQCLMKRCIIKLLHC